MKDITLLIEAGFSLLLGYIMPLPELEPPSSSQDNSQDNVLAPSLHSVPPDVANQIFYRLSFQDLLALSATCKAWHQSLNAETPSYDVAYQLKGYREMRRKCLEQTMGISYLIPAFFNHGIFDRQDDKKQALELIEVISTESTYGMKSLPCNHFKNLYETGLYTPESLIYEPKTLENSTSMSILGSSLKTHRGFLPEDPQNIMISVFSGATIKKTWRIPWISFDELLDFHTPSEVSRLSVNGVEGHKPYLWGLSRFKECKLSTLVLQNVTLMNFAVLGMFEQLKTLNVHSLDMTELPKELTSLSQLNKLTIEKCHFLKDLSVISKMSNLSNLTLNNNASVTSLPQLPQLLKSITLNSQYLINNLEYNLSKVTGLLSIELKDNQITKLPDAILKLPELWFLSIEEPKLPQSEINKLAPLKQNPNIQIRPDTLNDRIP